MAARADKLSAAATRSTKFDGRGAHKLSAGSIAVLVADNLSGLRDAIVLDLVDG